MSHDLDRLFNPASVAIIGASQDLTTPGGQPVANLKNHGYRGPIYPVNPKYPEIGGYTAYPSVAALPERPDLALIIVSAARVPAALRECGEKGIPYAIIFSSGFSEVGDEGAKLQDELVAIARQYRIGIIGPNCQGVMNIPGAVFSGFGSPFRVASYRHGPVSMVTQSGGFGYSMVGLADEAGLGFCKIVSIGNEAGLSSVDLMQYFVDDPESKVVVGYIEGLRDASRLIDVGRSALRQDKPVLIWKVGRTETGQKAAAAHTGNLGGGNVLYETVFRQVGMIEIEDLQDLIDCCRAFLRGKRPAGNRVAVVSASGGAGVVLADRCAQSGLVLPSFDERTVKRMREVLPSYSSVANPVDPTASVFSGASGNAKLRHVLQALIDDANVDSIVVSNSSLHGAVGVKTAQEIIDLDRATDKPIFVSWSAREALAAEAFRMLEAADIPFYRTPVRCGKALGALTRFTQVRRKHIEANGAALSNATERPAIRAVLAQKQGFLSEYEAKGILREYGINGTREVLARDKAEAQAAAKNMGFPVALKVQSPDLPHKTEAGALRLGIASEQELDAAYDAVIGGAKAFAPAARPPPPPLRGSKVCSCRKWCRAVSR
jgi:acyl-CoA synthetase (NDP forming)